VEVPRDGVIKEDCAGAERAERWGRGVDGLLVARVVAWGTVELWTCTVEDRKRVRR